MEKRSSAGSGRPDVTRMPRQRMSLEDRAKIFVPFDPLVGFRAALRNKELEVEQENERLGR